MAGRGARNACHTRAGASMTRTPLAATAAFVFFACARTQAPPHPSGLTATAERTLKHGERVWTVSFSPDGKLLATASVDNSVRIWRVADGALVRTLAHPEGVTFAGFSPDGQWIASGSYDNKV